MKRESLAARLHLSDADIQRDFYKGVAINQLDYFPTLGRMTKNKNLYDDIADEMLKFSHPDEHLIDFSSPIGKPLAYLVRDLRKARKQRLSASSQPSCDETAPQKPEAAASDKLAADESPKLEFTKDDPDLDALTELVDVINATWPDTDVTEVEINEDSFDCKESELLYKLMIEPFVQLSSR